MRDEFNGNGYSPTGGKHLGDLMIRRMINTAIACSNCGKVPDSEDTYCSGCGNYVADNILSGMTTAVNNIIEACNSPFGLNFLLTEEQVKLKEEYVPPSCGVYIYYHPYEQYKIGKGEKILTRRLPTHRCSAPSLELLHVIETADQDWLEVFLHKKFQHRRIRPNHEYFALTEGDLDWLFRIRVLDPPRSIAEQMTLLELL